MPELPEVETVCRGIAPFVTGKKIKNVQTFGKKLRLPYPENLAKLSGITIQKVRRRAKYILLDLDTGETLIIHLGMSGQLLAYSRGQLPTPRGAHDHLLLTLMDGTNLLFRDPRRFGLITLGNTQELAHHPLFKSMGPEPLEKAFSKHYLCAALRHKNTVIKTAIMDQKLIVGVGNIYASESLFLAKIDPRRKAKSLTEQEAARLCAAIKKVLKSAIKSGGSTLRDYVRSTGDSGYFQHHFQVYDRDGQHCLFRHGYGNIKLRPEIRKIVQQGRSTYFCPSCQH